MPRYDYRCRECGIIVEIPRRYSDDIDPVDLWCEECQFTVRHDPVLPRQLTFQLKGEGFYVTDNRDEIEKYLFKHFD